MEDSAQSMLPLNSAVPREVLGDVGRQCSIPTPPSSLPREVLVDDGGGGGKSSTVEDLDSLGSSVIRSHI